MKKTLFLLMLGGSLQLGIGQTITTAVPFLLANPDAATLGVGQTSIATQGTACSYLVNPAKMAFQQNKAFVAGSYGIWMPSFMELNFATLVAGGKIGTKHSIAVSERYFGGNDITFYDVAGFPAGVFDIKEQTLGISYAYQIHPKVSLGANLFYLSSSIGGGLSANSAMGGIGALYQDSYAPSDKLKITTAVGVSITNIGPKINFSNTFVKEFIPTNFGFGAAVRMRLVKYLLLNPSLEFNKLLVPSTSTRARDVSYLTGVFTSGFDAPGGFKEELQEISGSGGLELGGFIPFNTEESKYLKMVLRLGYFGENKNKGNRKYATVGTGVEASFGKFLVGTNMGVYLPTQQNSLLKGTKIWGLNGGYKF